MHWDVLAGLLLHCTVLYSDTYRFTNLTSGEQHLQICCSTYVVVVLAVARFASGSTVVTSE